MVQQLTRAGKRRQRCLKTGPTGFMHSTMCRLAQARSTKAAHRQSGVWELPGGKMSVVQALRSCSRSSCANMPAVAKGSGIV